MEERFRDVRCQDVGDVPIPEMRAGIAELDGFCREEGRSLEDLTISMRSQVVLTEVHVPPDKRIAPLTGPLPEVLADLRTLRELGVEHIALWPAAREPDLDAYLGHMEWIARDIVAPLAADR